MPSGGKVKNWQTKASHPPFIIILAIFLLHNSWLDLLRLTKYFLFLPVLLAACKVMLIGAYDPVTDESIQQIQNETMTMLVKMERNFDNHEAARNNYEFFREKYEQLAGEMESLKIRCKAIPKYDLILDQVNLLQANLQDLEKYHKAGFKSKEELEPIKKAFESTFSAMIVMQNALKRKKSD
jgi:hypothetical protein